MRAFPIAVCAALVAGGGFLWYALPLPRHLVKEPDYLTNYFDAKNWSLHFRPDASVEPAARQDPQQLWSGLFDKMAADPSTRELLQKIFAPARLEWSIVDPKAVWTTGKMDVPPGVPFDVAIRLQCQGASWLPEGAEKIVNGQFGFIRSTRIENSGEGSAALGNPPGVRITQNTPSDEPTGSEAFAVAVEDYTLRTRCGWICFWGPSVAYDRQGPAPGSPEHRADLARRIAAATNKVGGFYAKLRGR